MNITCRFLLISCIASMLFLTCCAAQAQTSLDAMLKPYLARYELPAIAAAVVKNGKIITAGAAGTRRMGAGIPVTIHDRFHLGSDTKAMTSLLAAMLVEEGNLRWNTAMAEVFPELAENMDPGFRKITLEQLLSHTSGIPSDNEEIIRVFEDALTKDGNLDNLRYFVVSQWCRRPLVSEPGTKFAYSNLGYTIAGSVIERVAGKTWDELITERIFIPLKLRTAGLGQQASLGRTDAPLGHYIIDGKAVAMLAGPNGDVPPIIGPAGIAHMSILDFATWAGWHAAEGKRKPYLVRPETLRRLHAPVIAISEKKDAAPGTPSGGKYAFGWAEIAVDWASYPLLYHGGSNEMNLAHIWIDTRRDLAIVITTNIGGPKANTALLELARALYIQFTRQ